MPFIPIRGQILKDIWVKFDPETGEMERIERGIRETINLSDYVRKWQARNPPPADRTDKPAA